ncbi:hypothetical protein ATY41_02900 [Leifsonia xyli subsp. xyli]|uniref:Uncharacterized protein n=2 Tax=Leifsonia xyli subsp. xyli TaxID=59736 RepID=Q6AC75_LEIXX|nr:hypothetical protein [Leifsonia xyli]AAT90017.1 hypothetical protein Lxx23790 [Leifsonia xyli subsp. xyli str. CTCB07]ODA90005.1 hypothetical protein ATY41_02900 [Leifsonia xyli subsp. xyli]
MENPADRRALKEEIARRLAEGPVQVHAKETPVPLGEWRSVVREVASELGQPVTAYAAADTIWAALLSSG